LEALEFQTGTILVEQHLTAWLKPSVIERGEKEMASKPMDYGPLVSLGPPARLISAWGIAPGIVNPPILLRAPKARFIAFDKYAWGTAMPRSPSLTRAFSS
jgi:hypothetical protein